MSSTHPLNNDTPVLNTQLGLPLLREMFVAPETSTRSDLYAIRQASERSLELRNDDQMLTTMRDVSGAIGGIIASNESGFADLSDGLSDVRDGISDMTGVIHGDFQLLQGAVRSIYGTNLPKDRTLSELGQAISYDGKNTALAMLLLGGLEKEKAQRIFGSDFVECLTNGVTAEQAKEMNNQNYAQLRMIKKQKDEVYEKSDKMSYAEFCAALSDLRDKESYIQSSIISPDSIRLLGETRNIRGKNVMQLVEEGLVNPKILEVMVRNGVVNGDVSDKLARIIREDENGNITPLIELSGVTGIFQQNKAQTMLQNIMVQQGNVQISQLGHINNGIDTIGNRLRVSNRYLGNIDMGIERANQSLGNIDYGIQEANGHLMGIHETLGIGNELQMMANMALDELINGNEVIADEIALTREVIAGLLEQVGDVLVGGFGMIRSELRANRQELRTQNILQAHTLVELGRQTQILSSIEQTLETPGNTRSDELVREGIKFLQINRTKDAEECFMEAVTHSRANIFANYGAGIALKYNQKGKAAIRHFHRAEDIALQDGNFNIAASALLEQAKIFVKFMNLRKAEMLLEKADPMDPDNLEIPFLKAKLFLIRRDDGLLEIELERIFKKVFVDGISFALPRGYEGVINLLKPVTNKYVNSLIGKGNTIVLRDILGLLEAYGFEESLLSASSYIMMRHPEQIIQSGINMREVIVKNPKHFDDLYTEILSKNSQIVKRQSGKIAYQMALWGYKILPFELIDSIIHEGVMSDVNFICLRRDKKEDKKPFKDAFVAGFYSIGNEAKNMFRDYLLRHPEVNGLLKSVK